MSPEELPDEDLHGPTTEIGDHQRRCSADGYLWPCPTVRLQPRTLEDAEKDVLAAVDIGPGCTVHRRQAEGCDTDGAGGIVIRTWVDDDGQKMLRAVQLRAGRARFTDMAVDDVEPMTVGLPNSSLVRSTARALAGLVSKQRGVASMGEMELLGDAYDLLKTIA